MFRENGFEKGLQSVRRAGPPGWPPPHHSSSSGTSRGPLALKAGIRTVTAQRAPSSASPITIWRPRSAPSWASRPPRHRSQSLPGAGNLVEPAAPTGCAGPKLARTPVQPCHSALGNRPVGWCTGSWAHLGSRLAHQDPPTKLLRPAQGCDPRPTATAAANTDTRIPRRLRPGGGGEAAARGEVRGWGLEGAGVVRVGARRWAWSYGWGRRQRSQERAWPVGDWDAATVLAEWASLARGGGAWKGRDHLKRRQKWAGNRGGGTW